MKSDGLLPVKVGPNREKYFNIFAQMPSKTKPWLLNDDLLGHQKRLKFLNNLEKFILNIFLKIRVILCCILKV